ncbi:MAG: class I SAM-dependent methyltransferase [Bacteroidota bacterium]
MAHAGKLAFFDAAADRWDGAEEDARLKVRMAPALLGIGPDEHVVDLGCGTGILTGVLAGMLSARATITAVDFSPAMIARARGRLPDVRIRWVVGDAEALPLSDSSADRVLCFSAWPHFEDQPGVCREAFRILRKGGLFRVFHTQSRREVNRIHAEIGGAVGADVLVPGSDLARLMEGAGFRMKRVVDDEEGYSVEGRKG